MEYRETQLRRRDLPITWIPGTKESPTTVVEPLRRIQTSKLVGTHSVIEQVDYGELQSAVKRHLKGDWGLVSARDATQNNRAVQLGKAVISAFQDCNRVRFWIISSSDRSRTVVMLPSDFRKLQQPQPTIRIVWDLVKLLLSGCHRSLRWLAMQDLLGKLRRIVNRRFVLFAFLVYAIPEALYYMLCQTVAAQRELESLFAGF
jgi:hypothetical protein